jgi:hypothetical protein
LTETKTHKFDEKLDITYGQYIKDSMAGEIALQRELEKVLGKDEAHKILREWSEKRTVELVEQYLKDTRTTISNFEDFKKHMDEEWASEHVSRTHTCETTNNNSDKITYKVTECIWAKMMRESDAPDLGLLTMCDMDFISAKVYHPNIKLIREKTLMNGDDYCDFTYVWKKEYEFTGHRNSLS